MTKLLLVERNRHLIDEFFGIIPEHLDVIAVTSTEEALPYLNKERFDTLMIQGASTDGQCAGNIGNTLEFLKTLIDSGKLPRFVLVVSDMFSYDPRYGEVVGERCRLEVRSKTVMLLEPLALRELLTS